ncbi:Benzoate 1,2-dioxygenase [Collimonas arenae]|uniref:Benzoate 1,2-dioxygenase n=1 Tax=Collimonas arenae TaxID=279058 RepID=A0A0A1FAB3_9BURK|nr:aromatic ring-hydroxylating dioxygenase subunit alpha [Collimonas arenae]AIY40619.1 Benzoate 1,2-dioxygenase [Collimonas arenae]
MHHMEKKLKVSKEIQSLIAERLPGHSLDAPFYLSPEIFDLDIREIFSKHWIHVAVEPDIPEPGDYVTVEIGLNSIVVVRDDDMAVRAYHNVCRHRGARLCSEHKGSVGNLVCPYHQWTYNIGGELIYAEHMGEKFDRSKHSLKSVHVENLAGLIFICLAEQPPQDFSVMRDAMAPYLLPHGLKDCKIAKQVDLIEEGNWKLTMENNRECYHCATNHPELTASLFEFGFGYQSAPGNAEQIAEFNRLAAERCGEWERGGLPSAEIERLDELVTGFRTQRLPLDRAGESQTLDGKVASGKLLGEFERADLGGLSFWTQPNSWHHFMSDHIVSFSVLPLSAERTLVRTKWLVHKDAREGIDYQLDNLTAVWNATNDQDKRLVELSQQGARSSAYQPGPYSPFTEGLVEKFCTWYIGRLSAGLAEQSAGSPVTMLRRID